MDVSRKYALLTTNYDTLYNGFLRLSLAATLPPFSLFLKMWSIHVILSKGPILIGSTKYHIRNSSTTYIINHLPLKNN